jgi:hypothetical protein
MVAGDRSIADTKATAHSVVAGLLNYVRNNPDKFFFGQNEAIGDRLDIAAQLSAQQLGREEMGFFGSLWQSRKVAAGNQE